MASLLTYKQYGNQAILIEWPAQIDEVILDDILSYKDTILSNKSAHIVDCVIGYHSIALVYREDIIDFEAEKEDLLVLYSMKQTVKTKDKTLWKIPVCYDSVFGIDLKEMALDLNLTIEEIIQLHSEPI